MAAPVFEDVFYIVGAVRHLARPDRQVPLCGQVSSGWQLRRIAPMRNPAREMVMRRPLCTRCDRMVRGDRPAA